ncbi:hypothetical protein DID88_009670 [Monilinia fructigena]|uniref:CN hydrolase domain-containing protein n=1 Tax=Monilinia fructigena TaxID=38457 RepID=A0A395ICH8_9HELO|nr:hypothetical protein DID88_009670 [Monilinia fructigena]
MAWRTREDVRSYSRQPKEPIWIPLPIGWQDLSQLFEPNKRARSIVVFANRTGVEDDAVYTGTSAVLGICGGEVKVYGLLGRGDKELLVVDTSVRPKAKLVADPDQSSSEKTGSDTSKSSRSGSPASSTSKKNDKSKKQNLSFLQDSIQAN